MSVAATAAAVLIKDICSHWNTGMQRGSQETPGFLFCFVEDPWLNAYQQGGPLHRLLLHSILQLCIRKMNTVVLTNLLSTWQILFKSA